MILLLYQYCLQVPYQYAVGTTGHSSIGPTSTTQTHGTILPVLLDYYVLVLLVLLYWLHWMYAINHSLVFPVRAYTVRTYGK